MGRLLVAATVLLAGLGVLVGTQWEHMGSAAGGSVLAGRGPGGRGPAGAGGKSSALAAHLAGLAGTRTTLPTAAPNTALGQAVDPGQAMADPFVLVAHEVDYLYASENATNLPYVPVRTFQELGQWGPPGEAMPKLPGWAGAWAWNPDVRYVDGRYVMWFTAFHWGVALPVIGAMSRCLGWATSSSPLGPFIPSATPAVCQVGQFGAIDPRTFVAPGGQEWLYWKSDDNAVLATHKPTVIWAQRLASDGVTLVGPRVALMSDSQPWEGRVVESPQMVLVQGHYYLFFSGNISGSSANGIGVARCEGPGGPCANSSKGPWFGSSVGGLGVGEESLFTQGGVTWMLYSPAGFFQTLAVARVAFGPQGPYLAAFSSLPKAS